MARYFTTSDEFIGFGEIVDIVNHNAEVVDRHIDKCKKFNRRANAKHVFLVAGMVLVCKYCIARIEMLEKKVEELEKKGD